MDGGSDGEKLEEFERMTHNPAEAQAQVLDQILHLNAGVEYLARCGFSSAASSSSSAPSSHLLACFKAHVPLVSYEHIRDDIQRIADGDRTPILTAQPAISFTLSSGTSAGKPKMLLLTPKGQQVMHSAYQLCTIFMNRFFPSKTINPTSLAFVYAGKQFETKSGLKLGAISTHYYRSEAFKRNRTTNYTSPDEVILGYDVRQSMYCHLICGLIQRDEVEVISAIFAFALVEAVRMLQEAWQEICTDITHGVLGPRITDTELRSSVQKCLKPNPQLADIIKIECSMLSWEGILERLWPKAKYVSAIVTGAMLPYAPALRKYSGKLPIVGENYTASECFIGYNSDLKASAEDISFFVAPDQAFFEFIHLKKNEQEFHLFDIPTTGDYVEKEPVGLAEVKLGEIYEIVVTTFSGLYRYRLGDVVKVTGFHNATPQIAIYGRKNAVLCVNTDKTDEQELHQAVQKAAMVLNEVNLELTHYTSFADISSRPGHYVLFWELNNDKENVPKDVLEICCSTLDTSFNNQYMRGRAAETIGPLELCVVKRGTFGLMQDFALSRGATAAQYKIPRCVTSPELLSIIREGVVQTCYSPKFPEFLLASWKPEI